MGAAPLGHVGTTALDVGVCRCRAEENMAVVVDAFDVLPRLEQFEMGA